MSEESPDPRPGSVQRTPGTVLAVAAMLGAGVTWMGVSALQSFGQPVPRPPLLGALALVLIALAVGIAAYIAHQRIQVRRERVTSQRGVTLLVLGKTSLIAGVGLAAAYLTITVMFVERLDAALPRERVIAAGASALACLALAVAGWFLERACEVPRPPDDEETPDAPQRPAEED